MKNMSPSAIGRTASPNGQSDTLLLGSRKKMINGQAVSVTVLYSRSGKENIWERLKLFLFGDFLKNKAKQKIVDCLTKNPTVKQNSTEFLREINRSDKGVSASNFLEVVVQARLSGVDPLEGIEVIHGTADSQTTDTVETYLQRVLETLLTGKPEIKHLAKVLAKLLLQPQSAKKTALTPEVQSDLRSIKTFLKMQTFLSEKMRDQIIERIDELMRSAPQKPAKSTQALQKQEHITEKSPALGADTAANLPPVDDAAASEPDKFFQKLLKNYVGGQLSIQEANLEKFRFLVKNETDFHNNFAKWKISGNATDWFTRLSEDLKRYERGSFVDISLDN